MAKFVPFIIKTDGSQNISVKIVRMKKSDAVQTEKEPVWQTSWLSDYIQDDAFEKYALKTSNGELVALAAYEILENDVMVHITYIESQPESNPTIVGHSKKYQGIGRVLIAYGSSCRLTMNAAGRSRSRQRFRSWQSIMSGTMELVHCRVLAVHRVMNFLVRRQ